MTLLRKHFSCIDPGAWPESVGSAPRVLVEHPSPAHRTIAMELLRAEGYEVAGCPGAERGMRCPLIEFGSCWLVEDADVVVTTAEMADAVRLLDEHRRSGQRPLVVEVAADQLEEIAEIVPDAVLVTRPLTAHSLRAAVGKAQARIASDAPA
jgi:AmiR/NasT family two-component response regulator